MKTIKAGVIGTGFIGPAHIEAIRRIGNADVIAICSIDEASAKLIGDKFSIPKIYSEWQQIISDPEIEVIHNCTPNNLHYEINKAAILNGKHIVSEKPLTINVRESEELCMLAEEKKIVNAVNFNYRFYPLIQHARLMVEKGDVGEIFLIHGNYLQDWLFYEKDYNWRLESNVSGTSRAIADIGSHWCDIVQFVAGSRIKKVFADLVTIHKTRKKPTKAVQTFKTKEQEDIGDFENLQIDTEDAGSVLLNFENGARGVFIVSQVSAGRKNHFSFEIDGSKKAISWNQEEPNKLWIGSRDTANELIIKDPSLLYDEARQYAHYPGGHPEGYPDGPKNLFMKVYDFIRAGKDPIKDKIEFPTFKDGYIENKIVDAILLSNKDQKWIEIDSLN